MKLHTLLAAACSFAALSALPACGPGVPATSDSDSDSLSGTESDSDSDSNSGTGTTDPFPALCNFEGVMYEDGEEFQTDDGCLGYRCESGVLNVLADNLVEVQGDLDLAAQEDVDALECLWSVTGSLTISGTAADLSQLNRLARVGGDLSIAGSDAVTLAGLEGLGEIGGSIVIADNAALTTMTFQTYMSVFGDVTIQNNDALTSLAGAEFIGQCSACSTSAAGTPRAGDDEDPGNDSAGDSAGAPADPTGAAETGLDEPGGGTFYGNILIADNDVLADVFALNNLWYAWANVRFRNNAVLTDLASLPLTEVQGDFEVSGHPAMDTSYLEDMITSIDIWGTTTICGNLGGAPCQ